MKANQKFILGAALLTAPLCVHAQQAASLAEHIKTIEIKLNDPNAERVWQYRPDGQDFVCVNGNNKYTRALYGSHDEDRVETSDRPVFVTYKMRDSRNVSFLLTLNGTTTVNLVDADYCEARYTAGRRSYVLTDRRWGQGKVIMSVLAYPDRQGGIWQITTEGFSGKVEMTCRVCEIQIQNLKRWGDMGAEVPGSLDAPTAPKQLQAKTWNATNNTTYATVENQTLAVSTPADTQAQAKNKADYEQAEAHREALASWVVFKTPDPYFNTLGGVLATSGDGCWDGDTFLHGAVVWRVPLAGWRGAYMGDFLGWPDRAVHHFDAYAESQVRDVPCTRPHATPDTLNNLCRGVHEWGTPMYSNGYICRLPHRNDLMHHYDMNLNYIDELLWHFQFDADPAYLRKMWPVLKSHLAWEKMNWDPNDDGLYDAYCCIWASDGLYYNSGGVAHSSAYNYRGNLLAARIAEILGEDAAPYRREADKILKALNERLWMKEKGCWAEYQDLMGLQRRHESAALWTVYTPIDSYACTPEQAYAATKWVDNHTPHIPIRIAGEQPKYYTLSTTNWMPYDWSINNVAPAEEMHTALAFFHAGRTDEAFRLMKGVLLDEMYLGASPGNMGQVSYYDAARGETYRDFADNVAVTAKAAIEGLYGISPQALDGKLIIRPGFPTVWDSASVHTSYIDFSFRRENGKEIYDITQRFARPLQLVIRQNTGYGTYKETVFTSDQTQHIELPAVNNPQEPEVDMQAWTRSGNTDKDMGNAFDDINEKQLVMVNIDKQLNAKVTDIFRNEYVSPASPYTTLRIPKNGFGEWCHPTFTASSNDSVFRTLVKKGTYTAQLKDIGKQIPFRSKAVGRNIVYTSLWDNYPDSVTIPLKGKASHAYLLMAGTTNHMQSRIENGRITITYTDGTQQTMDLVNPDNWCPIEQDYYYDQYAFRVEGKHPYRVHLMSDIVSRNLGKELNLEGIYGRLIDGGAGQLLDLRLNPKKQLKSLTLTTLSNDVVIGLMGITLQRTELPKTGYLFAYFSGNKTDGQQLRFALSRNGVDYEPLNGGQPVMKADTFAVMKAIRDPHILRCSDGWFRMVMTDFDMSRGKWTNRGIIMSRSRDLVHWENHAVHFPDRYVGKYFAQANAVWAPQTIYDPSVGKYMVYFSLHSEKDGPFPKDAVYFAYANDDFTDLATDPQPLFRYPNPTIDTDIVQDEAGVYHLFFNTWGGEEGLTRKQYTFTDLHHPETWTLLPGRMQPNAINSEGSCALPLIEGGWILMYDCYKDGFYQFCRSDDLQHFELLKSTPDTGIFTPRHGTAIQITEAEYQRLKRFF